MIIIIIEVHMRLTLDRFLERLVISDNGCWIAPIETVMVWYKDKSAYVILAIFDRYNKKYNGKIYRTCKNKMCFNPNHLISLTAEEKFWSNINIKSDEKCWEWKTYAGTNERPNTHFNGKNQSVSRLAYKLIYGDFDDSLYVCHHCDNPPCCNPNHLFLGTRQDNVDDREAKGRNKMPHSIGEDHGGAKLTKEQILEIRNKYIPREYSYYKLAREYGVTFGHIRNIIQRKVW